MYVALSKMASGLISWFTGHNANKWDKEQERIMHITLEELHEEYIKQAHEAWEKTWEILHTEDGWKLETGKDLENGRVHSHNFKGLGKIFKLEGVIHCAPRILFESLVQNAATAPEWNPTVLEARIVQTITDNIDILYNVAAEAAGGLVSKRDFVSIRHWKERNDILMSAGCAVAHPECPPTKKCVRGENRTGGWAFMSVPENPNECNFTWILSTDLKGWLPQYAIDQALGGFLMDYFKHLKLHVEHR